MAKRQTDAEGQFDLRNKCYEGEGVPQDYEKAVYWYAKAAEQGHAGARALLNAFYIYLMSVTQTVEIPADRRLTIDIPREIPAGRVILTFTPASDGKERMSEEQEMELFRLHADELNAEAEDVLLYQSVLT